MLAPVPGHASECQELSLHRSEFSDVCSKRFMQNLTRSKPGQGCSLEEGFSPMSVHQGDCVNLDIDDDTYQVIGVDGDHNRCWVRRWPLQSNEGSPVFEISLERIRQVG